MLGVVNGRKVDRERVATELDDITTIGTYNVDERREETGETLRKQLGSI
jgi:hypothetical protein